MKNSLSQKNSYKDFDEIADLLKNMCKVDAVCIHAFEFGDLVLASKKTFKQSFKTNLKPILEKVCSSGSDTVIEDVSGFINTPSITSDFQFYMGFPVKDNDQKLVGVISLTHKNAIKLNPTISKALEVLLKSVLLIYERQEFDGIKKGCLNQMLELNNGFYLRITKELTISGIGPNFALSIPQMKVGEKLSKFLVYQNINDFDDLFKLKKSDRGVHFFNNHENSQRYKFSFLFFENEMVIAASPIINAKYTLKNYGLKLNDFSKHDYIAEFMFLQQTSERSLAEARAISDNLVKKNIELKQAQKEIGKLSKFPSENPNPILRLSKSLDVVYTNLASQKKFNSDFGIKDDLLSDKSLRTHLKKAIKSNKPETYFENRNNRYYSLTLIYVKEFEYINIYASNITNFIKKVNQNEQILIRLKDEIQSQKEFYEFILNNLPADVAVFDKQHKYIFINPKGIKDKKVRDFMIGKDDFEYAKLRGIPEDKAIKRRKVFNSIIRKKTFLNWTDEFLDKNGQREVVHRTMGPLFDDKGKIRYVIGYGTDITKRVVAEEENIKLSLVAKNTNNGVLMLNKDRKIIWANNAMLRRSGYKMNEISGKTSSYFSFEESSNKTLLKVQRAMDNQKKVSVELLQKSKSGKKYWVDLNVQPLYDNDKKISGYMFVEFDITDRIEHEQTIQNLNVNLERLVQEKTTKNIELSNSLRDQEKMVTIGELAAGVAHDLNTPLGAIRSGVENIKYTLNNLFNEKILLCSSEEFGFALKYAEGNKFDLYIGGMQLRKETSVFTDFLLAKYPDQPKDEVYDLSALFVKNRISSSEKKTINDIVNSNNARHILNLLYDIQIIFSFVDTIKSSGERASLVVQDLRSFIREKKNTKEGLVNLHDNIKTVLNIFNYNIKNLIELNFDVNKNILVNGYDVRLFQLWSNLIKNSIECMEDMTGLKKLNVYSKNFNKTVSIIVENNGPIIPNDQIDKIFQKFYTTKGKRNGSGLGLSIVKNVLEEHNAKILVKSNERKTQFKITFKKEK